MNDDFEKLLARTWLAPALLTLIVALGYAISPTRLPLNGEETSRAWHGVEMAASGDWVVATRQFAPVIDRPPMHYWTLAIVHRWIHELDPVTLRLTSAAITLAMALVILWYTQRFLSPAGAFLAAVAYPTMGQVFDLGRRAETDALFTLLLAGALLVWHYGYQSGWPALRTWAAACLLAALATLTKGLQGPIAFFGAVYLFILVRRDWRTVFCRSHFAGLAVFCGTIAAWQIPFYLREGWRGTWLTWFEPCTARAGADPWALTLHLATFPLVVLGATLPWSGLLSGMLHPGFWKLDERARSAVIFLLCASASIFGPVWISERGFHRYVMPVYPLLAVLCGIVVDRALSSPNAGGLWKLWFHFIRLLTLVLAGVTIVFAILSVMAATGGRPWSLPLAQPWWLLAALAICIILGGMFVFRRSASARMEHAVGITFVLASLVAISFNGPIINAQAHDAMNVGPDVAAVREHLGKSSAGLPIVSFGKLHHRFLYYYGEHIPMLPRPESMDEVPEDVDYFAIGIRPGETAELPFEWEEVAELNMERGRTDRPTDRVVIGRYRRMQTASAEEYQSRTRR